MLERKCPQCEATNAWENVLCASCGAALVRDSIVVSRRSGLVPAATRLPAPVKQVGQAVAVSLAALVAEAGISWLRRRVATDGRLPRRTAAPEKPKAVALYPNAPAQVQPRRRTTVWQQRVTEVWRHGRLEGRQVERTVYRQEDE